jgi:hypothetical protein
MSDRSARIKPLCAIFCDDIRREDNGKELLIGIYSANLQLSVFPASIILSVWVPFERTGVGKVPIEFRLIGPDGMTLGFGTMELNFTERDSVASSLPLRGLPTILLRPGEITFQLRQHDESWETVRKLTIEEKHRASVNS